MKIQEKVERFYKTYQKKFSIVSKFSLFQEMSQSETPITNLDIELLEQFNLSSRFSVRFYGVRELNLMQPIDSVFTVAILDIRSIADRQWEGLIFKVQDAEEGSFRFLCGDFEVITV